MSDGNFGLPASWPQLRRVFHVDGSLRDLVIGESQVVQWEDSLRFVRALAAAGEATINEEPRPLPPTAAEILALRRPVTLTVHVGAVAFVTHFFDENEVEFDLSPADVRAEADARTVLQFMEGLARETGRPVHLTLENMHETRLASFWPSRDEWTFDLEASGF